MKKKIIGIILTLTMVLTLLPAFALPTKADSAVPKDWEIKKANGEEAKQGSDGEYDCKPDGNFTYVDIGSSDLVISGVLVGSIRLNSSVTKVTFKNLTILPDDKYYMYNPAVVSNNEEVEIVLEGKNYIGKSSEDENIFRTGIEGQNLTFSGNGNLDIYSLGAAISVQTIGDNESEGEEEVGRKNLTFNLKGDGKVKVVQCEAPFEITEKVEESVREVKSTVSEPLDSIRVVNMVKIRSIDGAIYADGNINITDGKLEVINLNRERHREVGSSVYAGIAAVGNINISTAKTVSVKSNYGIAAVALGDVTIGTNVKDLILYGSLEILYGPEKEELMSLGALASAGTITNKSGNELLGGVVEGPDFKEKDLGKVTEVKISLAEKIKELEEKENLEEANEAAGSVEAFDSKVENVDETPEMTEVVQNPGSLQATMVELSSLEESFPIVGKNHYEPLETITTYTVNGKVANALMIKAPDKNPETEDTSAMLIWAFAGLAALAVAAGILVSRKQRD